jgi:hypothetical protein
VISTDRERSLSELAKILEKHHEAVNVISNVM